MIVVQTSDPNRSAPGLDGNKAMAALDAYRRASGEAQAPVENIQFIEVEPE